MIFYAIWMKTKVIIDSLETIEFGFLIKLIIEIVAHKC
jgi:hypothetical protein